MVSETEAPELEISTSRPAISESIHREGRALSRLSSWAKEGMGLTVQDVQIVQDVQAVSEGIGDLGWFAGFVAVYFAPFMPLRFR
jgi:hypothetical protein